MTPMVVWWRFWCQSYDRILRAVSHSIGSPFAICKKDQIENHFSLGCSYFFVLCWIKYISELSIFENDYSLGHEYEGILLEIIPEIEKTGRRLETIEFALAF